MKLNKEQLGLIYFLLSESRVGLNAYSKAQLKELLIILQQELGGRGVSGRDIGLPVHL